MLHFNELRLTPDNKCLIIDVEVDNIEYYEDIVLDSIVIDTQDTFIMNGPSNNPLYVKEINEELKHIYSLPEYQNCNPIQVDEDKKYCFVTDEKGVRHYRLELSIKDLKVNPCDTMFFIYVIALGTPHPNTPCGYDTNKIMGTVVNIQSLYLNLMSYLKELSKTCDIPKGFIDAILRIKALDLSIKTGNYIEAIKYWKKFFKGTTINNNHSNCNCHG